MASRRTGSRWNVEAVKIWRDVEYKLKLDDRCSAVRRLVDDLQTTLHDENNACTWAYSVELNFSRFQAY